MFKESQVTFHDSEKKKNQHLVDIYKFKFKSEKIRKDKNQNENDRKIQKMKEELEKTLRRKNND